MRGIPKQRKMTRLSLNRYIPEYQNIVADKQYGISKKFYVQREQINPPYRIKAVCFDSSCYFSDNADGLKNAKQWLKTKRDDVLRQLGVFDD